MTRKYLPAPISFILFFLTCYPTCLHAQVGTAKGIDRIESNLIPRDTQGKDSGAPASIATRMAALGVPGVSIAVFDQGRIVWARGYGQADKSAGKAVDTSTLFQAASISKPVTSAALLKLSERKLIDLYKDINLQLRSWKIPSNAFTDTEKVTPQRLISHMAGLTVHGFYGYNPHDTIPTLLQILDGLHPANSKPVRVFTRPGSTESYSGGGFEVLQLLMQEVTGKSFSSLMSELILQPAHMNQSTFSLQLPPAMAIRTSKGYHRNGDIVDGGYHVYPEQAAAGLWTTPSDLARFMLNIGDAYRGKSGGLLQPATVQFMLTRVPGGGGSGFGIDGTGDAFRFRHSGGNEGFNCYAVSFAQTGRGVVIMTNSDNGTALIRELLRAISKEYQWPPMWPRE